MTTPPATPQSEVDRRLNQLAELYRSLHPEQTPEETAREHRESRDRLASRANGFLDAADLVACVICHHRRPRRYFCEPRYYPASECLNVRKPWHHHYTWNKTIDKREGRRHRRRVRKGRLPHARPASGGAT